MPRRILREPLIHFLAIGAALFLVFHWTGTVGRESNRIVITRGQIESLAAGFERTWRRPPTEEELKRLLDDSVREEIAAREAQAMGLDRDDTVVRRRLRQKFEFIAEEIADSDRPSDAQLEAWLARHPDSFRRDPQVAFRQVFLDRSRRGNAVRGDAERLLTSLSKSGPRTGIRDLGDPIMLPAEVPLSPTDEVTRTFGKDFAEAVLQAETGRWAGPVESGFGLHLVLVTERLEGRLPALSEVRDQVEREFLAERRKARLDALYQELLKKYQVEVAKPETTSSGKTAAARGSPATASR